MSEYVLYHHGVKGMKWGVRRERAKRARMGGRLDKRIERWNGYIAYREHLKRKNSLKGKSNSKIDEEITAAHKTRKSLIDLRDRTVSGLTKQEIKAGEQFVHATFTLNRSIEALSEEIITNRYIKNNS